MNFFGSSLIFFMENELPKADSLEEIAYNRGFREIFLIEGDSMLPTLRDGDLVLINPDTEYAVGDIVLAAHPFKKSVKIIKRIVEILPNEKYFLVGDNATESSDSRAFGAISAKHIFGKVVCRIDEKK